LGFYNIRARLEHLESHAVNKSPEETQRNPEEC